MLIFYSSADKTRGLLLGALALSLSAIPTTTALAQSQSSPVSTGSLASAAVNPASAAVNPASAAVNPASAAVNPASAAVNPASAAVNPASAAVNPASAAVKSSAGLDKKLIMPAKRQPLSKLLHDIQTAAGGGVQLSQAGSVEDESIFCAVSGKTTRALLAQIPRLLTDNEWQYQWLNRTPNTVGGTPDTRHSIYRLWRQPVDAQARQAFARQQAHNRLSRLLADLQAGKQDEPDDPDAATILVQPMYRSGLALVGSFPDSQIAGILAGQPMTVPFSSLSPEQQALATQATGGCELGTSTAPDGSVTVDYDKRDLAKTGRVVVEATPSGTDPGALTFMLSIYSQPDSPVSMGGDVLHPDPTSDLPPPDAAGPPDAGAPNSPAPAAPIPAVSDDAPAVQAVTLDAALTLKPGQTPLEGYLSALAAQTHLSVLGYWAEDAKEPRQRLSQSITQRSVKDTLDILARTYHARYVVGDQTVLFRSKFPKPAPAKSVPKQP